MIEKFLDYVSNPDSKMSDGKPLKKTVSRLRREDSCCFMGAICEFAVINGVIPPATKDHPSKGYAYKGRETFPPNEVLDWINFDFYTLRITPDRVSIITANDWEELSFKQIADVIRVEIAANVKA